MIKLISLKAFKVADIDKEYKLTYDKVLKWLDMCLEFKSFVLLFTPVKIVLNIQQIYDAIP